MIGTVKVYYGNTLISTSSASLPVLVTNYDNLSITVDNGESKTLNCKDKYMNRYVYVGDVTLLCRGKMMDNNITITASEMDSVMLNQFTISADRTSIELIKDL